MPNVNGKKYSYTKKGKEAARKAMQQDKKGSQSDIRNAKASQRAKQFNGDMPAYFQGKVSDDMPAALRNKNKNDNDMPAALRKRVRLAALKKAKDKKKNG